jgi:phage terminase large subunit
MIDVNNVDYNQEILVAKPFAPMWLTRNQIKEHFGHDIYQFINISGRLAGKTLNFIMMMFYYGFNYPNCDIVVLRANSSQLKQSIFKEFRKYCLDKLPISVYSQINFRESPPLEITLPAGNTIFFSGVGMGSQSGSNQSRGKTTDNPISLIIFEETQEIFSGSSNGEDLLMHSLLTYVRFLDDNVGKIIYAGNRERNHSAKFNVWVKNKQKDKDFLIIESSYLDIYQFLNQHTIRMIEQEKEMNPNNYKYFFLGQSVGGDDLVYGAFTETVHVLPKDFKLDSSQIYQTYIGVDGSTTRDKTVFMPIFHLRNGKMVCKLGDMLYHDPIKNGVVRNNKLCELYVKRWYKRLLEKYNLFRVNVTFVVDGHNVDLIDNLEYEIEQEFPQNTTIMKFTRKDLNETSEKVNNALTNKILYFTNEKWKEMISGDEVHPAILFNELETVCWREDDGTKFNDLIPNDMTDAIRYPIAYHVTSPYQLKNFSKGG